MPEFINFTKKMADNFDSCKHRSLAEESYQHKTCCRTEMRSGFRCNLLQILPLSRDLCANCLKFEKREEKVESAAGI